MRALFIVSLLLVGCGEGPLWEKLETGVDVELKSMHGLSPNDVWAVGRNGTVIRFDGTKWEKQPSGTSNNLTSVWAASANDVWMVGESKSVLRWNGTTISVVDAPQTFTHVMGSSANEVFFCGSAGLYAFSNGAFQAFPRARCSGLFKFDNGVVALMEDREVHRLSTAGSSLLMTLPDTYSQRGLAMVSTSDVWEFNSSSKSVLRYGGAQARELVLPTDMSVHAAFVRSANDVWLVGGNGYAAHFDGTELKLKVAGDYSAPELQSVWGSGNITFAVGSNGWAMRLVEP